MRTLSIDFETRSSVDLPLTGVYPYAAHPSTEILCAAYAFDDEEPRLWVPTGDLDDRLPLDIINHVLAGGEIRAWNAQFERLIWFYCWDHRDCTPRTEQFVCTAAEAAAMALPRALGQCAEVLGVEQQKDAAGNRLMMKISTRPDYRPTDAELAALYEYCKQDVRTEQAVARRLRRLTPKERSVYLLDQRMNDTGIRLDRSLVVAAKGIVTQEMARADAAMNLITGGVVSKVSQIGRFKAWLGEQGVNVESLDKVAIKEMLETGDLPPHVTDALRARADGGKSSVAKLDAMLAVAGDDDVLRGLLLYHGASTGRWSGRLVQPQNFPRGTVKVTPETFERIMRGEANLDEVSSSLRGMLIARPGEWLHVADYAGIEARLVAWCAGQHDALDIFRTGGDPYKVMASRIFGVRVEDVTPEQRQVGKAAVLGCGYGMGWQKFQSAAWDVYGVRVDEETAKVAVAKYREAHGRIVEWWSQLNDAALDAVRAPGASFSAGPVRFRMVGPFLWCVLPSGRPLCYPAPKIVDRETPWGSTVDALEFGGVNSTTRKWQREGTYGGKLAENVVQAIARDVMAEGLLAVEAAGFTPLLSVHDEGIAEGKKARLDEFCALLATPPSWCETLPLKVEGYIAKRYRK